MEPASPARLYASAAGALLLVAGVLGFFYSASFGSPGEVEDALGVFPVNGWLNVLYILTGALGLLVAGASSRGYSLAIGLLYTVLAAWGWSIGGGGAILDLFPTGGGNEALHLALGLLGLAAAAGTPRQQFRGSKPTPEVGKEPRNSRRRSDSGAEVVGEAP